MPDFGKEGLEIRNLSATGYPSLRDQRYGYRIYFTVRKKIVVILLAGGHKDSQQRDIDRAKEIERELK